MVMKILIFVPSLHRSIVRIYVRHSLPAIPIEGVDHDNCVDRQPVAERGF